MVPVANRIFLDLGPLRESRGFRLLFAGQFVEVFGSQLTAVAIPFQVYELTRSSLQVGLVSLAQLVPLVAGALTGGSPWPTRYDRRESSWWSRRLLLALDQRRPGRSTRRYRQPEGAAGLRPLPGQRGLGRPGSGLGHHGPRRRRSPTLVAPRAACRRRLRGSPSCRRPGRPGHRARPRRADRSPCGARRPPTGSTPPPPSSSC